MDKQLTTVEFVLDEGEPNYQLITIKEIQPYLY
jgi:hypothetical protein